MKLEWLKWFHEEITQMTEMTDADRKEKNTKVNIHQTGLEMWS